MNTLANGLPLEAELPPLREVEGGAVRVRQEPRQP